MRVAAFVLVAALAALAFVLMDFAQGATVHCGCSAGKNSCGMPCVSCCAPSTCSMTETPSACRGR